MRTIDALLEFQVKLRRQVFHAVEAELRQEPCVSWAAMKGEACAVCEWLDWAGPAHCRDTEAFKELRVAHADFHRVATRLCLLAQAQRVAARELLRSREFVSGSLRCIAGLWCVRAAMAGGSPEVGRGPVS